MSSSMSQKRNSSKGDYVDSVVVVGGTLIDPEGPVLESIKWTAEMESLFFQAFISSNVVYKPTGVNKHFHMLVAYHRFIKSINRNIDIELLWDKLETLYDLDVIDRQNSSSSPPFPNEERDFKLPEDFKKTRRRHAAASAKSDDNNYDQQDSASSSSSSPEEEEEDEEEEEEEERPKRKKKRKILMKRR